jgi:hypothetical protein
VFFITQNKFELRAPRAFPFLCSLRSLKIRAILGGAYKFVFLDQIVYNYFTMAKRKTGVGNMKKSKSHKTKKRLATKKEMLAKKASKGRK